jgi:hypothetical protein
MNADVSMAEIVDKNDIVLAHRVMLILFFWNRNCIYVRLCKRNYSAKIS